MVTVRFKCPSCGEVFRKLKFFVTAESTYICPKCGAGDVPMVEEDADRLKLEAKDGCSSHG